MCDGYVCAYSCEGAVDIIWEGCCGVWMDRDMEGRAAMSVSGRFGCSVCRIAFCAMYPAVARAGCRALAHESRIELCAPILLMCLHCVSFSASADREVVFVMYGEA